MDDGFVYRVISNNSFSHLSIILLGRKRFDASIAFF